MSKQRIGTLMGKPIIKGDINLKTSNEIHISELTDTNYEIAGEEEIKDIAGKILNK